MQTVFKKATLLQGLKSAELGSGPQSLKLEQRERRRKRIGETLMPHSCSVKLHSCLTNSVIIHQTDNYSRLLKRGL